MTLLTVDEIRAINRKAQRYGAANCWTGTSGTLAADIRRLANHIMEGAGMACEYPEGGTDDQAVAVDHILRGAEELKRERAADGFKRLAEASAKKYHTERAVGGTTAKFGTGAVRSDSVEEFRYDLVSPIGLREVARTCAEGAAKYGDWNWERGMPVHDLLNHAVAHIYQFLAGDRSEPHLGHAAWNLLAAIHSHELWPDLNSGTLRGDRCSPPHPEATRRDP